MGARSLASYVCGVTMVYVFMWMGTWTTSTMWHNYPENSSRKKKERKKHGHQMVQLSYHITRYYVHFRRQERM